MAFDLRPYPPCFSLLTAIYLLRDGRSMCRLLVFKGIEPITLSNLVTKPAHSIINQAFDARLRLDATRSVNGDGFGLGWYDAEASASSSTSLAYVAPLDDHPDTAPIASSSSSSSSPSSSKDHPHPSAPCIFTSVTPAWNNQNLQRLCEKIRSPLVFAHIRASTAGALSETNCHPWRYGRLMWMHNGQISSFGLLKRTLLASLDDELLNFPQGQTDSEWAFALFLSHLDRPGREETFAWGELKGAMERTIADLNRWAREKGVEEPSLMNFCVTDGQSIVCTRYVSSLHDEAASLYFSSGTSFYEREKGRFRMRKEDRRQNIVVVASEPLTFEKADWMEVPTNTMIIVTPKMNVLQIPILDEYSPIDRPHPMHVPVRAPYASSSSATSTLTRREASLARSQLNAKAPSSLLAMDDEVRGRAMDNEGAEDDEAGHLQQKARGGSTSTHRSPAYALNAGFPPNSHIASVGGGAGTGGSGAAPGVAAAAAVGPSSPTSPIKVTGATSATVAAR
ncbi:N-terminal nucleophile aminohydrolase [Jaminaea rosea]|uniref:N-terminal nucleophile aminohydrolase n=1 Tax=Jaminaea rosea TaxID=1569628 RepID=A0A316V2F2_9BASI|nr:N-terminal nucleophile aminohydrolase [Jaminaea rosea]PWN29605.1 N-terminal nucleophile aminohydrolase [Jaminaea rosea]